MRQPPSIFYLLKNFAFYSSNGALILRDSVVLLSLLISQPEYEVLLSVLSNV